MTCRQCEASPRAPCTERMLGLSGIARSLPGPSRDQPMSVGFYFLVIETLDICGDLFKTVLHGKVSRVEMVHLRLRYVSQISFSSFAREEYVILSPKDECFRLAITQELLPLGIERYVRSVIIEKVHLDAAGIGPLHEAEVHVPVVGTDQIRMLVAVEVDRLYRVKL